MVKDKTANKMPSSLTYPPPERDIVRATFESNG